jgi:hypothetical protein
MFRPLFFITCIFILALTHTAHAQQKPNAGKEKFYDPYTHKKLFTTVSPRLKSRFTQNGLDVFNGTNGNSDGCPEEINIGSIVEDSPIYGGVDNQVFIDGDIVIKCD